MNDLRLYILMRTDVPTMNPGKAVAQGSHAANQCIYEGRKFAAEADPEGDPEVWKRALALEADINEWEDQSGKGFGTQIVLGVNEDEMRETVRMAKYRGFHAGITHDPTYPTGMPPKPISVMWPTFFMAAAVGALLAQTPMTALAFAAVGTLAWIKDMARYTPPNTLIPLDTCAYVFGRSGDLRDTLGSFGLMR